MAMNLDMIKLCYNYVIPLDDNRCLVKNELNDYYSVMDSNGCIIQDTDIKDAKVAGKRMFRLADNFIYKEIYMHSFDDVEDGLEFEEIEVLPNKMALIRYCGLWGILNKSGDMILNYYYDAIKNTGVQNNCVRLWCKKRDTDTIIKSEAKPDANITIILLSMDGYRYDKLIEKKYSDSFSIWAVAYMGSPKYLFDRKIYKYTPAMYGRRITSNSYDEVIYRYSDINAGYITVANEIKFRGQFIMSTGLIDIYGNEIVPIGIYSDISVISSKAYAGKKLANGKYDIYFKGSKIRTSLVIDSIYTYNIFPVICFMHTGNKLVYFGDDQRLHDDLISALTIHQSVKALNKHKRIFRVQLYGDVWYTDENFRLISGADKELIKGSSSDNWIRIDTSKNTKSSGAQ